MNPGDAGTPARQFTQPLRELCAFTVLAGNAVFLLLGVGGLFFSLTDWAGGFGLRSATVFDRFAGPLALGLPMVALLLATHVAPMLPRARVVVIVVIAEYGVSAFFGAISFLGAFAYNLKIDNGVVDGLLGRMVWLVFLAVACVVVVRVWMGLFPAARTSAFTAGYRPAYGQPYPGQPLIPQPAVPQPLPSTAELPTIALAATALPVSPTAPTSTSPTGSVPHPLAPVEEADRDGWPAVPPPPMPEPVVLEADPTMRISLPRSAQPLGAEETQVVPSPAPEPPTQRFSG